MSRDSNHQTGGEHSSRRERLARLVLPFLWEVKSMDEAIEWIKRCPNPMPEESEIEVRPLHGMDDFGENVTPEVREQEQRLRAEIERRQSAQG